MSSAKHRLGKTHLNVLLVGAGLLVLLLVLEYFGIIWHTSVFALPYEIRGLDVSHHQNDIDWQKVTATQKYAFVFIKATEGHDFFDDNFATNWREAKDAGLAVGAYHFFSMRSPGNEQAEYFASIVPVEKDSLAPVIDIEIHSRHDPELVRKELQDMIDVLEIHYSQQPILYVTETTYLVYIKGHFDHYRLWFRDIVHPPLQTDNWLIWQYNNRGHVDGISTYVDINALKGSVNDLR